jgi:glycosyltransferase
MNLYLFNANDSAATYGIGTYLNELTLALDGSGINVHIVHLHSVRTEFEIVRKDMLTNQVENWYVPEICNDNTFSGSVQKLEDYYRNVIYLLRLYIKDTTDLVFHFNYNQSQTLSKGLKEVFNCKTVATVHYLKWTLELQGNLHKLQILKSKPKELRTFFEELLHTTDEYEHALFKEADRVIVLSKSMKNLLCDEYQLDSKKMSVIPNGLSDTSLVSVMDKTMLRRTWRLSEKEFPILFVGRLHPVKGLLFLIKAFRKVLRIIPNCRLLVAGNGHFDMYRKEAKDANDKVTFTGLLDKQALSELYQIADIGVVPSLYESFGYVAVEMMMHGLPVIATATSGLNEVVDETCGLKILVTDHSGNMEINVDLLAENIVYLLQHPDKAMEMGQSGRKKFLKKYSTEVFRQNMVEFYRSLLISES